MNLQDLIKLIDLAGHYKIVSYKWMNSIHTHNF